MALSGWRIFIETSVLSRKTKAKHGNASLVQAFFLWRYLKKPPDPAAEEPFGMSRFSLVLVGLVVAALPALAQGTATTTTIWAGVYTDEQAVQGARLYPSACSVCHGKALEGVPDEGDPALASPGFMVEWDGQTMADLVHHIHTGPSDNSGGMDPDTAVAMAAFILNQNGVPSGKTPLSTDAKEEAKILFKEQKPK
jgi:mono/diheme cytochrome c family protein